MKNLKIYYIYHSCFVVETKNYLIVFDYFKKPLKNRDDDISLDEKILNTKKKVLIFSSHSHYDHFNKEIFSLKNKFRIIEYILSSDIIFNNELQSCHKICENEVLDINEVKIKAYGSTDLGVSFLVEVDTLKIFHAGDLNWWYWKDDTPDEEKYMKEYYQKIIEQIRKNNNIGIAFFPVDPRLEEFYCLGGEYFAENVKPKIMIPMHFDENFYICKEFKEKIERFDIEGALIERTNYLLKFKTDI
ncbi:MAG: MBL fold metallo-hydrolase [Cetobacterium sp.]|uniref:MBL fold metallo-hydrolase n=1 Tax=Cetobacterium sp. TaxID=2071632 RepID=UPI003EE80E5F